MLGNMSGFSFLWQCLYFSEYLDCCQHLAGAILPELSPSSVVTKEVANSLILFFYLLEERKKLQSKAYKMDGSVTCTCISLIAELLKLISCAQWPLVHLHCLFKSFAHILIRCFIAVVQTFRFDYQSLFFYIVYKYFLL